MSAPGNADSRYASRSAGTTTPSQNANPQVANNLGIWISPVFAVAVSGLVARFTSGKVTTQESREAAVAFNNMVTMVNDVPPTLPAPVPPLLTSKEVRIKLRSGQMSASDVIKGLGLCRQDEEIAMELVEGQKRLVSSAFMESHMMYLCITTIKVQGMVDRLVLKIGYTADWVDRMPRLQTTHKCTMLLCGMVPVKNEQFEKKFHLSLALRFPHLVCNLKDDDDGRVTELYLCDRFRRACPRRTSSP